MNTLVVWMVGRLVVVTPSFLAPSPIHPCIDQAATVDKLTQKAACDQPHPVMMVFDELLPQSQLNFKSPAAS